MTQFVSDHFARSRRWRAEWVWPAHADGRARNSYCLFRRVFTLEHVPPDAMLFITADTRYELWINGRFVGRGALMSQPFFKYYDQRDMGGLLQTGRNTIAVMVNHTGTEPDTRGGLVAELADGSGETLLATDDQWRAVRSDAWRAETHRYPMNVMTPFQEHFDARRLDPQWTAADFDDASWSTVDVLGRPPVTRPWSRLVPRDIPEMAETTRRPRHVDRVDECLGLIQRARQGDLTVGLSTPGKHPHYATVEGPEHLCDHEGPTVLQCSTNHLEDHTFDGVYDPCVLLDFGRVITAYIELDVEGPAGATLDIGYAERLIDGQFNNAVEGHFADRCTLRAGEQQWRPTTWKSFRYVKLRLRDAFEPVTIRRLEARTSNYPFEHVGRFESSDHLLNDVFDISRYTIRLCSNQFIMDTPWREAGQWLGDVAAVTLGGIYACFGDTRLPGKFLRQSAANQLPTGLMTNMTNRVSFDWQHVIPDYSLWWIRGLWRHFLYTGEPAWIHTFWPHVQKVIDFFAAYVNGRGLLEHVPHWVFIDWADVDKRGECAALNAIYCGALESAHAMAEMKGDAHSAERYLAMREAMNAAFTDRFFDADRQCVIDAVVDGQPSTMISEHANLAAIRFGLVDEAVAERVIATFYERPGLKYTECQPFFTSVVLEALHNAGRMDLALEIIRRRWGDRMVKRGARSVYEEWGCNGSWREGEYRCFMRSQSHAWSAAPAEFLIRRLMGLEILAPGCGELRVAPAKTDFDYVLVYPTPHGLITVKHEAGEVTVDAPDGVAIAR